MPIRENGGRVPRSTTPPASLGRHLPTTRVNIDPGYLLFERFVLATGKNYSHRIYIGEGIYADLTLIYQQGAYRPLPWTYPDYSEKAMGQFLMLVRKKYRLDISTANSTDRKEYKKKCSKA